MDKCKHCNEAFKESADRKLHERVMHPSSASLACSIAPSPRLKTGDLDCVMHGDGTLEVRCSGRVGIHMVKSETADFLQWINQHQKQ